MQPRALEAELATAAAESARKRSSARDDSQACTGLHLIVHRPDAAPAACTDRAGRPLNAGGALAGHTPDARPARHAPASPGLGAGRQAAAHPAAVPGCGAGARAARGRRPRAGLWQRRARHPGLLRGARRPRAGPGRRCRGTARRPRAAEREAGRAGGRSSRAPGTPRPAPRPVFERGELRTLSMGRHARCGGAPPADLACSLPLAGAAARAAGGATARPSETQAARGPAPASRALCKDADLWLQRARDPCRGRRTRWRRRRRSARRPRRPRATARRARQRSPARPRTPPRWRRARGAPRPPRCRRARFRQSATRLRAGGERAHARHKRAVCRLTGLQAPRRSDVDHEHQAGGLFAASTPKPTLRVCLPALRTRCRRPRRLPPRRRRPLRRRPRARRRTCGSACTAPRPSSAARMRTRRARCRPRRRRQAGCGGSATPAAPCSSAPASHTLLQVLMLWAVRRRMHPVCPTPALLRPCGYSGRLVRLACAAPGTGRRAERRRGARAQADGAAA